MKQEFSRSDRHWHESIFELLTKMNHEFQEMKTEINNLRSEMHCRFDNVDAKLEGIGLQFELTNDSRINDVGFITQ
ncbi:hypothetical protein BKP35_16890 [Anaerobacillus arseniciselenatis]|uniref:Uncharacterized protein n=2 Tax=Anaerobacillus arseniciselenatis TaxID=85682 RepID=A0A1S2LAJ7_9BACI|nr:hypothetical protein BKP35_16890 [Anaerobacillus arseniciselenatis]